MKAEVPSEATLGRAMGWILTVVFALSFLKGFRLPNLWVATHLAFNYSQGFVRRGLVGEIFRWFNDGFYRYGAVVCFAFALMAVAIGLLVLVLRRALRAHPFEWSLYVASLVFLSSPALVFFVHAVGYSEYFGLVITLLAMLAVRRLKASHSAFFLVLTAGVTMVMIHEVLGVMFAPVLVFMLACDQVRRRRVSNEPSRKWLLAACSVALVAMLLLGLSIFMSRLGHDDSRVLALQRYIQQHADFRVRKEGFDVLRLSSGAAFQSIMPRYWREPYNVGLAVLSWQAFLPSFSWLLWYGVASIVRATPGLLARAVLTLLFMGASLTPLLLNLVGYDWNRWNAVVLLATFTSLLTLKTSFPSARRETSLPLLAFGIATACVGLAATTPLFDGAEVQFFPFDRQLRFIESLLEGEFSFRPRA